MRVVVDRRHHGAAVNPNVCPCLHSKLETVFITNQFRFVLFCSRMTRMLNRFHKSCTRHCAKKTIVGVYEKEKCVSNRRFEVHFLVNFEANIFIFWIYLVYTFFSFEMNPLLIHSSFVVRELSQRTKKESVFEWRFNKGNKKKKSFRTDKFTMFRKILGKINILKISGDEKKKIMRNLEFNDSKKRKKVERK